MTEQIITLGAMLTRVFSPGESADASTTLATATRRQERRPGSSEYGDDDGVSQGEWINKLNDVRWRFFSPEKPYL